MKIHLLTASVLAACATGLSAGPATILFGGDLDFGESYRPRDPKILAFGHEHSLEHLIPFFQRADVAVINLEVPLVDPESSPSPFVGQKDYIHFGDPEAVAAVLAKHGVDAVSLANNHTLDHGVPGLLTSLHALEPKGIAVFGAGIDAAAAGRPWETEVQVGGRTQRVAVFGTFEHRNSYETKYDWYADAGKPGSAAMRANGEPTAGLIRAYRAQHPGTFIVAFPHWGDNYVWRNDQQRQQAEAMLAAGADLILGHGAHCLGDIELINGRWAVYSLGNFVFNSPGRFERYVQERGILPYGLVGMLRFSAVSELTEIQVGLRLYPIYSDNRRTEYQPAPVSESSFAEVREKLEQKALAADDGSAPLLRFGRDDLGHYVEIGIAPVGQN